MEDLAAAAGNNVAISVDRKNSTASLLRDRVGSFDTDYWARTRTMSNLSVPESYVPSGSIGGLRDRFVRKKSVWFSCLNVGTCVSCFGPCV